MKKNNVVILSIILAAVFFAAGYGLSGLRGKGNTTEPAPVVTEADVFATIYGDDVTITGQED